MNIHVDENTIVVGVDGSTEGWHALRWAADRARLSGRPLHILHAQGTPPAHFEVGQTPGVTDKVCDEALGIVARHAELKVSCSQPMESPVLALLDVSPAAGEIVLGSRGFGPVRGAVLGSTTTRVAAESSCPVIVVRRAFPVQQHTGAVVVGVDARPDDIAALDFAFAEAERSGVPLVAVLCWQLDRRDFASDIPMPGGTMAAAHQHYRAVLQQALREPAARHPGVEVTHHVVCGPTAGNLAGYSADASLLVVGSRGHHELGGLLLGSVSQSLMRRAPVPVAVVAHVPSARAAGAERPKQTTA